MQIAARPECKECRPEVSGKTQKWTLAASAKAARTEKHDWLLDEQIVAISEEAELERLKDYCLLLCKQLAFPKLIILPFAQEVH
jgi:hypothetical protein